MQSSDILLIILGIIVVIAAAFYFFNRKNLKKYIETQDLIDANKTTVQIFVIDKKFERPTEQNLPKMIYEKLPRTAKMRKMSIIKAKVGPQIATLTSDKSIYEALAVKKNVKVVLSGMYIVNIVGLNLANKKKKSLREKMSLYVSKNTSK